MLTRTVANAAAASRVRKLISASAIRKQPASELRSVEAKVPELPKAEISVGELEAEDNERIDGSHSLFRRHLCPVCPPGIKASPSNGRTFGSESASFCCPARIAAPRQTVYKTVRVRRTKTAFRTKIGVLRKTMTSTFVSIAGARQTVVGRLYIDRNKWVRPLLRSFRILFCSFCND